jgi:hypothetical protein
MVAIASRPCVEIDHCGEREDVQPAPKPYHSEWQAGQTEIAAQAARTAGRQERGRADAAIARSAPCAAAPLPEGLRWGALGLPLQVARTTRA